MLPPVPPERMWDFPSDEAMPMKIFLMAPPYPAIIQRWRTAPRRPSARRPVWRQGHPHPGRPQRLGPPAPSGKGCALHRQYRPAPRRSGCKTAAQSCRPARRAAAARPPAAGRRCRTSWGGADKNDAVPGRRFADRQQPRVVVAAYLPPHLLEQLRETGGIRLAGVEPGQCAAGLPLQFLRQLAGAAAVGVKRDQDAGRGGSFRARRFVHSPHPFCSCLPKDMQGAMTSPVRRYW